MPAVGPRRSNPLRHNVAAGCQSSRRPRVVYLSGYVTPSGPSQPTSTPLPSSQSITWPPTYVCPANPVRAGMLPTIGKSLERLTPVHILMVRRAAESRIKSGVKAARRYIDTSGSDYSMATPDRRERIQHGSGQPLKMDPGTSAVTSAAREFVSASIP